MLEFEECLKQAMAVRGALGASLIDYSSGMTIGAVGRSPSGGTELTGAGTANVVRAIVDGGAYAPTGEPGRIEDVVITSSNGFHLITFVSTGVDARLVIYVWLDPRSGNVAMTRRSLGLIARDLVTR